jgi:hypothetical protein
MLAAMCSGKCEVISREMTIQSAVNVLNGKHAGQRRQFANG